MFKSNISVEAYSVSMVHDDENPVTRSFRIEKKYDEALREDAEQFGTSVNSLANQILKKYTESDRYFREGQSISLSPRTHENLINKIDDAQIIESGRESGLVIPKDRLLMRGMMLDRESVIWYISEVLGGYNDWFTCDIHERDNDTLLHLRHVYNKKWSLFLKSYLSALFEEILKEPDLEFDLTDSTVNLVIKD